MKKLAISLTLLLAACSAPPEKKAETPAPTAQAAPPAPTLAAQPEIRSAETKPEPVVAAKPATKPPVKAASKTAVTPSKSASSMPPTPVPAPTPVQRDPMPQQVARNAPIDLPSPPPPPPPQPRHVTLPSGTLINVRMIDSIDSSSDHVGQSFKASMASPVMVGNETIIPKGADVYVKLVDLHSAGNMSGTSELKVALDRLFVDRKAYTVESNTYVQAGESQGKKTAKTVGIGTAIGAAIGAIAGGKKGAVIGAGAGAGGGVAVEAATKGAQVRIESESAMTFRLEAPIELTLPPSP